MKKILAALTFLIFLIISQMHLVHAYDMYGMDMSSHHHSKVKIQQSIFCEAPSQNGENQCVKELIPDKAHFERDASPEIQTTILPSGFFRFLEKECVPHDASINIGGDPPESIYCSSEYIHMIGVLKDLN